MRKRLFNIYWKLQRLITPTLRNAQTLHGDILKSYLNSQARWLDLGCGHHILPLWHFSKERKMVATCKSIFGIDYSFSSLKKHRSILHKIQGDISELPFKDNSLDLVTANMVVEHLQNPLSQFKEINRILKPGGILLFHTPNALGYQALLSCMIPKLLKNQIIHILQGRKDEDIFDTYYRVNTIREINNVAHLTFFEVLHIKMVTTYAVTAIITPLAIVELLLIRILMTKVFKALRPNIIAVLQKHQS